MSSSQKQPLTPNTNFYTTHKNLVWIISGIIFVAIIAAAILIFVPDQSADVGTVDSIDTQINLDNGDTDINWSKYPTYEIALSESITITEPGVYQLTGSIDNGNITINTSDNVKLVLNSVSIKNSSGPAIFVQEAKNVVIFTTSGISSLEDGATYSGYEADEIGTIFSHDDLILEGEADGKLIVKSNNEDAIVGKDDLKITSGTYEITSVDDGIRGKDSVYIQTGNFTINAGGDGIKSTNTTDSDKGFVYIEDGTFNIVANFDGIQAETKLLIANGEFVIETGGGSENASMTSNDWGTWMHGPRGATSNPATSQTTSDSAKGLKAGNNIIIEQGSFDFNCSDDAIHSNNDVGIMNGSIVIAAGDDGVHADNNLVIDGGTIKISQSYEGIEGTTVTINSGEISLVASDDGINAAGGSDDSSMNRPGANQFSSNNSAYIRVRGGRIVVDASGDGIDSNGNVYVEGGEIVVYGPTNGADGALDYDGECIVTGGSIMAGGASGMAQGISSQSTVHSVMISFTTNYNSGTEIILESDNGVEIASYQSPKSFSSLVIVSPELQKGSTYTVKVNGTTYQSFTISSISTQIGNSMMNGGGMHNSSTRR